MYKRGDIGNLQETWRHTKGIAVNLLAYAFNGSNPFLSTTFPRKGFRNLKLTHPQHATRRNIPERIPGGVLAGGARSLETPTGPQGNRGRTVSGSGSVNGWTPHGIWVKPGNWPGGCNVANYG